MNVRPRPRTALAVLAVALCGCATTDPSGAFEDTRELVAGRHPGELRWLRDDEARAAAGKRLRELLAEPLTAEAAAEVALLRNAALQAELETLGIAQADLAQATRPANPGVSFTALSGDGESRRTAGVVAGLVDWLVLPLRRRLAEAELEHTRLEVGRAVLETAAAARLALLAYQASEELAERLALAAEIDQAAAEYADALYGAGNLTALERAASAAAAAESRAEARRARAEADRWRERAALALGLGSGEAWSARRGVPAPAGGVADPARLEEAAVADRLDLAAARWAEESLERALTLRRRTRLFPAGIEIGVEREREGGVTLTGPVVELRLPLFDTGKASVARLESELGRARWQRAALEAAVRSEVRRRAADLETAGELVEIYRDSVLPLRREVVQRTLAEVNQMIAGTFDLLAARRAEVAAERRAVEARADYWQARFELELALGGPLPAPDPPDDATGGHDTHDAHDAHDRHEVQR
jgi:outer membrane protein TolC